MTMIINEVRLGQDLKTTILTNNLLTAILQKVNSILLLNTLILRSGSDLFSLSYVYLYEEPVPDILLPNETQFPSKINEITCFPFPQSE